MQPSTPDRDAHNVEETRQRLGGVSRQTVYDLINSGKLKSFTIGKRRLIPADAIKAFIADSTQAATG